jgi:hypothetical protein
VGMDRPVSELESFRRDGRSLDCKEATFTGLALELGIGPRDVLVLEASPDAVTWTPWFSGVTTKPGALRLARRSSVRLVGLSKRVREVVTDGSTYAEQEMAALVRTLAQAHLPGGIIYDATLIPDLALTVGKSQMRFDYLGSVLDQLMAQAPGFVVAEGSSYTYDGVTYNPGDAVPPVTWGVLPDRRFFFRRQSGEIDLIEGASVTVSPIEPSAEEACTAVAFIRVDGSTYKGGTLITGPDADDWGQIVRREAVPPGLLQQVTGGAAEGYGGTAQHTTNAGSSWFLWDLWTGYFRDENNSTIVRAYQSGNSGLGRQTFFLVGVGYEFDSPTHVARVRVKANVVTGPNDIYVGTPGEASKKVKLGSGSIDGEFEVSIEGLNGPTAVSELIVGQWISSEGADFEIRVTEFKVFGVDEETLTDLAESYYKVPVLERLDVEVQGRLIEPKPFTRLTLDDGAEVLMATAEVEYKLTKAGGVQSIVRMGQGEDADLLAAGHLIQGKADRAQLAAIGTLLKVTG